ncbi:TPA_asm: hypothetical protein HUJ06_019190 [Nelumbo nucifera]|uniref:Uncharacterized protein n=1 Tax=Nelumbo nucifera TaxID=4432 RepID=A0A822ZXW9_NELNU|nr:TPA_asm: hypothetical protein HUJ06_019190 [Nelumbo nucifera]
MSSEDESDFGSDTDDTISIGSVNLKDSKDLWEDESLNTAILFPEEEICVLEGGGKGEKRNKVEDKADNLETSTTDLPHKDEGNLAAALKDDQGTQILANKSFPENRQVKSFGLERQDSSLKVYKKTPRKETVPKPPPNVGTDKA